MNSAAPRRSSKTRTKAVRLPPVPMIPIRGENPPTPERLMHAGVPLASNLKTGELQIVGPPSERPIGQDGVYRLSEAPLDRLAARQRLDEEDKDRNAVLFEAGNKLRRHWHYAGLSGIGSIDLNRSGGGDGNPAWLTPTSEAAAHHRGQFRRAREELDAGHWQVLFDVICGEASLTDAGRSAGFRHEHAANAVALDRIRRGLEVLAILWGHLAPAPAPAA